MESCPIGCAPWVIPPMPATWYLSYVNLFGVRIKILSQMVSVPPDGVRDVELSEVHAVRGR
jgi:hypothetical protein